MMETLLFMLVQLIVSVLISAMRLALTLAFLSGRLLAVLLPIVFRGIVAVVRGLIDLSARQRREKIAPTYIDVTPYARREDQKARAVESAASPVYRRRHTARNYWRPRGR